MLKEQRHSVPLILQKLVAILARSYPTWDARKMNVIGMISSDF